MYNRREIESFVLKVAISGPHQTFLWTQCNNQGRIYHMAQYLLGALRSDDEIFLVFTYIWLKDVEKISKVPSAPCNVNPARAIAWLVGVPIHYTIFKYQSISISPVFFAAK